MEKQRHQFSYKGKTRQVSYLVITALWKWELDADADLCVLGVSYREYKIKWICVTTGRYPRRTSEAFLLSAVKRRKLLWFCYVCRHDTLPEIIHKEQWMVVVAEVNLVTHGMNMSVVAVIAVHCGWQRSMGSHRSRCIYRSAKTTSGRHRLVN